MLHVDLTTKCLGPELPEDDVGVLKNCYRTLEELEKSLGCFRLIFLLLSALGLGVKPTDANQVLR